MAKTRIYLTASQEHDVKPLFTELERLTAIAQEEGKEMSGAALIGQLLWFDDDLRPCAEFVLMDAELYAKVYAIIKEYTSTHGRK